jgi:NADH-quinone oxidoreductase subunit L
MIHGSQPAGLEHGLEASAAGELALPGAHHVHEVHSEAGTYALIAAVSGTLLAYLFYGIGLVNPAEIKRQFVGCYTFLVEKWRFDDLYDAMFVQPAHVVASWAAWIDKNIIDWFLHACCRFGVWVSTWDRIFDERVIDRIVNLLGDVTFGIGASLRVVQTGKLRQYIMFIAIGVVALFVLLFAFFPRV